MKTCARCGKTKALEEFGNVARSADGKHSYCLDCARGARRTSAARHPRVRVRDAHATRARQYGLNPEELTQMLEAADGRCALCGKPASLVVDHDHGTGSVRGLLCTVCNTRLGWFEQIGLDAILGYLAQTPLGAESSTVATIST